MNRSVPRPATRMLPIERPSPLAGDLVNFAFNCLYFVSEYTVEGVLLLSTVPWEGGLGQKPAKPLAVAARHQYKYRVRADGCESPMAPPLNGQAFPVRPWANRPGPETKTPGTCGNAVLDKGHHR
jgi:hypothetical protein